MAEEHNNQEPSDNLDHLEFDSLSPLEEDAANMHEMFLALMKAGFNESQALRLVALLVDGSEPEVINFNFEGKTFEIGEDEE